MFLNLKTQATRASTFARVSTRGTRTTSSRRSASSTSPDATASTATGAFESEKLETCGGGGTDERVWRGGVLFCFPFFKKVSFFLSFANGDLFRWGIPALINMIELYLNPDNETMWDEGSETAQNAEVSTQLDRGVFP